MATNKALVTNIDNSDPGNYPNGRLRDNSGAGDGTPVNRLVYSDLHEFFAKLMRMAAITYNGVPDSEGTGYQLVDAAIALAGKNDFITSLGSAGGNVTVPLKFSTLKANEALICLASVDYAAEGTIKGSEAATKTLTVASSYKAGDYVRLIYNTGGVTLVRLADGHNLDILVGELNYLKAATNTEEYAGTSTVKATKPASNKLAFARRVNGADSNSYLASGAQNGLLSIALYNLITEFVNPVKNVGWFSGVDAGGMTPGTSLAHSGDVSVAVVQTDPEADSTIILVTVANAMTGTNYFVRTHVESQGTIGNDNNTITPIFIPVSSTQFKWSIGDVAQPGQVQSLKIHVEVVQIS